METITGTEIRNERVLIGHRSYVRCKFVDCSLVFDGTPDKNVTCEFLNCGISLEGAAVHTLQFLRSLWTGGAGNLVEQFGVEHAGAPLTFAD